MLINMKPNLHKIVVGLMKLGLTQKQIGAAVGCSQVNISLIYRGINGDARPTLRMCTAMVALAEKHGLNQNGGKKRAKKSTAVVP